MTLKKERITIHTWVEKIRIELNLERRLEALGLTEGSQITVLNNDKKGAMTVKFAEPGLRSAAALPTIFL